MEQQKLPNVTTALVLSIFSFICCCCSSGIGGVICSAIALYLVKKDTELYNANPDDYDNFSTLKTTKIVAYIGLAIGIVSMLFFVYQVFSVGGWDAYMDQQKEAFEMLGIEL